MTQAKKLTAELIGTFWLVLCGCGSAMFAAAFPEVGIGLLGVSLAFGLSVVTMAFAVGPISGAHLNPAVTVGLWAAGRFQRKEVLPYIAAQVFGAIIASACLYLIATGRGSATVENFAANGFAEHSPGGFSLTAGFFTEFLFTFMFLFIIIGVTGGKGKTQFAPVAIGLTLALIHLVTIPITNTSVNPARSTGPALLQGGWALAQLWMFWVAPLLGGGAAGAVYKFISQGASQAIRVMTSRPTLSST